jgi:hypothetical protein
MPDCEAFKWIQQLDNENTAFRCIHCLEAGHLNEACPKKVSTLEETRHLSISNESSDGFQKVM